MHFTDESAKHLKFFKNLISDLQQASEIGSNMSIIPV